MTLARFWARRSVLFLLGVIAMFVFCLPVFSQTSTGRIQGAVTDQSGGTIASAAVGVTNEQTGVVRNLTTDQAGEYVAPNLLPGSYAIRATAKGFKTVERKGILLEIDKDLRIDLQLSPGEVTQTVEVTGAVPLVDSTSVTLGGTLSNDTINDLPLNGRNFMNLLPLRPGVEQYPGGGAWTQASDGLRVEDQNWVVDGLDNNESDQGMSVLNSPGTAGDAATILPIDAIQEFNIEENPKAEWGWKPGAVVNVGLKSGTNSIHGTAYAFGREDAWDAKNYFTPSGVDNPPLNFEQWGGTVGGPIVKNKLFYFAGFEEQRYVVGNTFPITIPTTAAGVGPNVSIPDAESGLAAANVSVSPLSLKLLPLFGSTNAPNGSGFTSFPSTNKSDNVLAKIDYTINSHHTLSGSYFFGNDNNVSEDHNVTQPQWLSEFTIRASVLSEHWVWTPNARWVNEARFGFVDYNRPIQGVDHSVPPTQYGINTGVTNPASFGMPVINVTGFAQIGAGNAWPYLLGPNKNFDFLDQLSYLHGTHAFKFGGEIRYAMATENALSYGRGRFIFSGGAAFSGSTSLEDFLAGAPSRAIHDVGTALRNPREKSFAGFFQDDWRIKSKVTLNLGLRWEYIGPVTEANNQVANFVPGSPLGIVQVGQGISSVYKTQKTNFAPRSGMAWDISGKGTTVIRAGGGLFYDMLPISVFTDSGPNLQNSHSPGIGNTPTGALFVSPNGKTVQGTGTIATTALTYPGPALNWTLAGPVFPATSTITCGSGGATGQPCAIFGVAPNFSTPYVGIWTATLQHAFSSSLSLELAYIGNHGDNLSGVLDVNQLDPASPAEIACGHCEANGDRPFGAQYPYLSNINILKNPYISNYHGLQVTFTGRNYHGLSFVAGYTYSHALDDSTFSIFNYTPQDNRVPGGQYANSDFDTRHRLTLTTTYDIPSKKGFGQILEGWVLNSIITLSGAQPWWAFDTTDDISATGELMDRWNFVGNPTDFKANQNPMPCFGFGGGGGVCGTAIPAACVKASTSLPNGPGGTTALGALNKLGCYMKGNSVLVPSAIGNFGTMGRNVFRDSGFRNWDLSLFKTFKFKERLTAQFRVEFFDVLNHPNFANPYDSINGIGVGATADPSAPGLFGCECVTPDVAATNPVLGSGGARDMQLGLKLIF